MLDSTTTGMVDPFGQVVRECQAGNLTAKQVALTYAFGIRQDVRDPGITAANEAIRERFKTRADPNGYKALERLKNLAWDYVNGRKSP